MFILIDRESEVSLQEQVFGLIREQIVSGGVRAGSQIPSSRSLAARLAVSRNSIIFAYERLINEGYLITRPMVGTFVANTLPDQTVVAPRDTVSQAPPEVRAPPSFTGRRHAILNNSNIPIDFWTQRTDPRSFPLKSWRRLVLNALANAGHNLTEYGDPCGLMALRVAIADYVGQARGIQTRPEQVIILAGAQLALNLVLRLLAREGDEIIVENPCNQGAAYLFESFHLKLLPVSVDAHGIDPAAMPKSSAHLIYLTPSHQFPMGPTLSLGRRRAILDWAGRTGAYVIEDDYDNEFRYDGAAIPAMKAMSPDNVIYLGTFSKSLGAGLRTGFAIFPESLVAGAATAKALLDNGQVWLEQAVLAQFMASGGYLRHLRQVRQQYMLRRNALVTRLHDRFGKTELIGQDAGTHLAWRLPTSLMPAHRVKATARARNIGVYTVQSGGGHEYAGSNYESNWLLLGYASLSETQIKAGIDRLADAMDEMRSKPAQRRQASRTPSLSHA